MAVRTAAGSFRKSAIVFSARRYRGDHRSSLEKPRFEEARWLRPFSHASRITASSDKPR